MAKPRVDQLSIASASQAEARICTGQCGVTNAMLMADRKTSGAKSADDAAGAEDGHAQGLQEARVHGLQPTPAVPRVD